MQPEKLTKAPENAGIDPGTMRGSKWYQEPTREDDDPRSSPSSRVSDVVTGTNRSSYQVREPVEYDEERLAMKRDDCTPSASTSSSASTFSDWFHENEHNVWNPLLEFFCHMKIGMRMETLTSG